ncbi:uncharacterized protein C8Q71DRAFT_861934 [Rhodofomes roseus]|uniref:Uncharacterized protein n=1 Tax=Rhodofomes roseus TaxID=34475 RepID=A0ABQ8K306_9APHY|nr:uncharacterized protein C8Q71DRAFT_861934 [Rhodofomes roseus]KAH9831199.1 hypothetical protein C8Q71DRAFT_861934 [Rhodofomes roseus]
MPRPIPNAFQNIALRSGIAEQQDSSRWDPQNPPSFPLPRLCLKDIDDDVIEVQVFDRPTTGRRGMVWAVAARPEKQLSANQYIVLKTSTRTSGALGAVRRRGRPDAVQPARPGPVGVPQPNRMPYPLDALPHAAEDPAPHPSFLSSPLIAKDDENPYEFEVWEDSAVLDLRLARIYNITILPEGARRH